MYRGAWWAIVHGVVTQLQLTNTFTFPLISNKNSSFIRMLSMIPTEIRGLFIELNPRLNERPWQGEGLWALFPVSYKCNLRKCSPNSPCLPLRWWFPSGPPGDVNGSALWYIRAFRGLEHLTFSVQNCLASLSVSPGSTAAWLCKALKVLAAYNHQVLYSIHLSLLLCPVWEVHQA